MSEPASPTVSPTRSASSQNDLSERIDAGLANLSASVRPTPHLPQSSVNLASGDVMFTPPHGNPHGKRARKIDDVDFSPELDIKSMLNSIKQDTAHTKQEVSELSLTVSGYKETIDHQALQIKSLKAENDNLILGHRVMLGRLLRAEARQDDMQAEINEMKSRMMRNNLIIKTKDKKYASTKGEDTASKVKTFLKNELHVDVEHMKITRAHRMGKATESQNASMIANFPYASDHKKIFSNISTLGKDNIISKQYPAEIEERRHFAWATYKKEKAAGKEVRFDHTGQLYVEKELQEQFNYKALPAITAASLGFGAPAIDRWKSDITYSDNHAFQVYIYKVGNRDDVASARDLLYSDPEILDMASHIPYAYRLTAGQENYDSDRDYFTGTILLAEMKKLQLDGYAAFLLHNAPAGQPITMASKRDLIQRVLGEAKAELNKPA